MSEPAAASGPEAAIEVIQLTRRFGEMVALNNLTLSVLGVKHLKLYETKDCSIAPSDDTHFTVALAIHFLTSGSVSRWLSSIYQRPDGSSSTSARSGLPPSISRSSFAHSEGRSSIGLGIFPSFTSLLSFLSVGLITSVSHLCTCLAKAASIRRTTSVT